MLSLKDIESAVESLPPREQEELVRRVTDRLRAGRGLTQFPVVPATGQVITREELEDARDDS